jgi:hypothetical protein
MPLLILTTEEWFDSEARQKFSDYLADLLLRLSMSCPCTVYAGDLSNVALLIKCSCSKCYTYCKTFNTPAHYIQPSLFSYCVHCAC